MNNGFPVIVGIDLGTNRTGIAWMQGSSSVEYTDYSQGEGSVSDWAWRILDIASDVVEKVQSLGAEMAIIEEFPKSNKFQKYVLERSGLYWRVICDLQQVGIPVFTVNPRTLKSFVACDGRAEKKDIVARIQEMFPNCEVNNHDEADAKGLCCIGYLWKNVSIASFSDEQLKRCPKPPWNCPVKAKKPSSKAKSSKPASILKKKRGIDK